MNRRGLLLALALSSFAGSSQARAEPGGSPSDGREGTNRHVRERRGGFVPCHDIEVEPTRNVGDCLKLSVGERVFGPPPHAARHRGRLPGPGGHPSGKRWARSLAKGHVAEIGGEYGGVSWLYYCSAHDSTKS